MADSQPSMNSDVRPIPDPTVLTTEASLRQEDMLRTLIKTEIGHLNDLFDEKILGVTRQFTTQFTMLDARTSEQKSDTKAALDAALAAAKEAVANQSSASEKSITKSETATIERIKAVETLLTASTNAANDKVDDLKSRIVAIEAVKLGTVEGTTAAHQGSSDTRAIMALVISGLFLLIAIGSIAVAIFKP